MIREIRPIISVKIQLNDKGEIMLIPTYLKETPKDEIDMMNKLFVEWKTTKQVKYDADGNRVN